MIRLRPLSIFVFVAIAIWAVACGDDSNTENSENTSVETEINSESETEELQGDDSWSSLPMEQKLAHLWTSEANPNEQLDLTGGAFNRIVDGNTDENTYDFRKSCEDDIIVESSDYISIMVSRQMIIWKVEFSNNGSTLTLTNCENNEKEVFTLP